MDAPHASYVLSKLSKWHNEPFRYYLPGMLLLIFPRTKYGYSRRCIVVRSLLILFFHFIYNREFALSSVVVDQVRYVGPGRSCECGSFWGTKLFQNLL